jgi:DNA-binding SARP family transcriptional activator/tetratricopeptide (TPR) repeat protein
VEFRVLGPMEVLVGRRLVDLGGLRQQIVLACLALEANRVVPVSRLAGAIYGDGLPSTARTQTQMCVSSLRRLFVHHGRRDVIVTRPNGYLLQVEPAEIDLFRFEELVARARQARDAGQLAGAAGHYRAALGLWRGPALDGVDSQGLHATASRLNDSRTTINEECVELELSLGRHAALVGELTGLIAESPLRERLRGLLMVALYRSGRQAEALEVYRVARQTMIEELGIEPSEWLRQLERAILTSDPGLIESASASTSTAPRLELREVAAAQVPPLAAPSMLPTDIADFTGREEQLDAIRRHLVHTEEAGRLAVPVVVVVGKPGVGKTTLSVHVAHQEARSYPDGQLFVDLHSRSSRRVTPIQVLQRFLRVLGVPSNDMPKNGVELHSELYRNLLAERRMLIVLDNVGDEGQVSPLLPGHPGSAVLITSNSRLSGLPGAVHVELDVLEQPQSVELLSRIVGAGRVEAEAGAAAELAELCGHLPLALRIAGARLAARSHWSVRQLTERLENETRRLDELRHGGLMIRASISLAYEAVGEDARLLFRRLAMLDFRVFSGWVGAALLDVSISSAQDLLDDLADAQLIETANTGQGLHSQYQFHDLIRVFARERLVAEETVAERSAALERVLGCLLFLTSAAHRRTYGGDYLHVRSQAKKWPLPEYATEQIVTPPLAWFERERANIIAAVTQAANAGMVNLCWDLAVTSVTYFEARAYLPDWRETHQVALRAAQQANDTSGEAAIRYSIGSLHVVESRFDDARRELTAALHLFTSVGDDYGEALVVRNIAFVDRISGDLDAAASRYRRALAIFRRDGDLVGAAYVLHGLACVELADGQNGEGLPLLAEALELSRRAGSRRVEAQVLHRLGELHLRADEPGLAAAVLGDALNAITDIGDPIGEAYIRHGLGLSYLRSGDLHSAGAALHEALDLAGRAGERLAEARVSLGLAELEMARSRPTQAVDHLHQALDVLRSVHAPQLRAEVATMLSEVRVTAG